MAAPAAAFTRIVLLGTGGGPGFYATRAQPAQALYVDGVVYLVDCGSGVGDQFRRAGLPLSFLRHVFVTHYHSDHTANANAFAAATWIVQKAERDFMFSDKPQGIIQPAQYSALKDAKTKLLNDEDFDVFGDGAVVVKSAPGHTPGHQVLFVKLPKTGPVVLAGDLYHYPEERTTGRIPTFEFNAEQSKASRAKIEAYIKPAGAQLWIEHDIATHAKLPKAPAFVE